LFHVHVIKRDQTLAKVNEAFHRATGTHSGLMPFLSHPNDLPAAKDTAAVLVIAVRCKD
jgi:hypothetical protein